MVTSMPTLWQRQVAESYWLQQVPEGGVYALWKAVRAGERCQLGLGMGRVVNWGRRGTYRYIIISCGVGRGMFALCGKYLPAG